MDDNFQARIGSLPPSKVIKEINFYDNFGENDNLDENDNRDDYFTTLCDHSFMPAESFVCLGLVTMYTGNANDDEEEEEDDDLNNDNIDNNDNNDNNDYDDDSHKRCIYCISNRYYAHRCRDSLFFKTI